MSNIEVENLKDILHLGFRLCPTAHMNDYRSVDRSWYERLFTFPWKPLVRRKVIQDAKVFIVYSERTV
jgi:hypothetical protein